MPRNRTGAENLCLAHVREGLHDGRHVGEHQRLRAQLGARRGQREDDVRRGCARRRSRRVRRGGRRARHLGRAQGARACRHRAASARQAASEPGKMSSSQTRPTHAQLQGWPCTGPGQQKYQAVRGQPAGRHSPLDVLMRAITHTSPPVAGRARQGARPRQPGHATSSSSPLPHAQAMQLANKGHVRALPSCAKSLTWFWAGIGKRCSRQATARALAATSVPPNARACMRTRFTCGAGRRTSGVGARD